MSKGFQQLEIAQVQPLTVAGALQWRPLRRTLGVRAFGINAYTAENAGDEVVEDHTEQSLGHEEIYLVLSGRATFTVGEEELDVPAGSLVHLSDISLRRHAVAAEPDTTVLAVGAKPGAAYTPSAWEHYFAAGAASGSGDHAEAMRLIEAGLAEHPEHPVMLFNAACYASLAGDGDAAIGYLQRAYAAEPAKVAEWQDDSDLDAIRRRPDWPIPTAS
jgi:quercetin dioxygenase-like cupin family protein